MSEWSISIDIGGTFTDVVALDYSAGRLFSMKLLTTHGDPAHALTAGMSRARSAALVQPRQSVAHLSSIPNK